MNNGRARLVVVAMIGTFALVRGMMFFRPDADLDVAGYNIHHLFTGLLLIAIGGIPAVVFGGRGRLLDLATVMFGVGLSLALDEWVYLIATDGSNASYLLPISLWGGLTLVALAALYVLALSGKGGNR